MTAEDIREMSFQNVLDTILKPAGVHVGGYPEDLFVDLEEEDREKWNCNICYLVVREARECSNKHLFCHTCVFAWSLTYGENSQKCPMCRVDQRTYLPNKEVNKLIGDKRVKCPEDACSFRAPLKVFLMHSHGKTQYANHSVDLESLRPARAADGPNLIILPGGVAFTGDMLGGAQRAANIREQLQQGRAMIHQMMLLLHLEMQLRQQALVSYSQAQDPNTRIRRLDEVLALNEQLNEVGTILSALLSTPLAARGGSRIIQPVPPVGPRRVDVSPDVIMSRGGVGRGTPPALEVLMSRGGINTPVQPPLLRRPMRGAGVDEDDDDSSDMSDATSVSSVVSVTPRMRMSMTGTLHSPSGGAAGAAVAPRRGELNRPQRRNEIRAQLLSLGTTDEPRSSLATTPRLTRRDQNASTRGAISDAGRHGNNNSLAVSLQRLDSNNSTSSSNSHNGSSPTLREQRTILPLLPGASGNNPARNSQARQAAANASNSNEHSLGGQLPTGSSAHQRIMIALNSGEDDPDEVGDGQLGGLATQRPNSVSRHRPQHLTPSAGDVPRGPRVTSEGVTASGATFSTSADTPATRAAYTRPPPSSASPMAAPSGVTPSGAVYSTSADTPATRAASSEVAQSDSAANESSTTANSGVSVSALLQTTGAQAADSVTVSDANGATTTSTTSDVAARGRSQATSYAPQRRFRRNSSRLGQQGTAAASENRSGVAAGGLPAMVPYVPHRSRMSPPRAAAPRDRGVRTHSLSVEDRRGFSTSTRSVDADNSIVRRAARGGVGANRSSLPTTPGQLLRSRHNSQSNSDSRKASGPRNNPGGTI